MLSPDDSRLYVGCHDGAVYALDSSTGRVIWKWQTGEQVQSDQVLSADGETLYIGSDDTNVYAIDTKSGVPRWTYKTGGFVRSGLTLGPPSLAPSFAAAVEEGALYFGSFDGFIYCLSTTDGMLQWRTKTGGAVGSKPALGVHKPSKRLILYQGSFDGKLYALDASDKGRVVWTWDSGGEVHSDPALDDQAGVVYCATYAGYVFALKLPE